MTSVSLRSGAVWKHEDEFAAAVVNSLTEWLRRMEVHADLQLRAKGQRSDDTPLRGSSFMLADGNQLFVTAKPTGTMELSWDDVLDEVKQYILAENSRLEQLQGHDEGFVLASPLIRDVHREIAEAAAWGNADGPDWSDGRWQRSAGALLSHSLAADSRSVCVAQLRPAEGESAVCTAVWGAARFLYWLRGGHCGSRRDSARRNPVSR
jgi:hypothetical protein